MAIDWYLIVSFLFVFLVLVECIIVYILRPRKQKSKNNSAEKRGGKGDEKKGGDG